MQREVKKEKVEVGGNQGKIQGNEATSCTGGSPLQGQRHGDAGGSYLELVWKEACSGKD